MTHVRVIGIGSPFGNDQTGWQIIEILQQQHSCPTCEYLKADRPGINLLHLLMDSDNVVLIDAIDAPTHAGEIMRLSRNELLRHSRQLSSHDIKISEALALGQVLNMLPDELILFGYCIDPADQHPVSLFRLELAANTIANEISIFNQAAILSG